MYVLKRFNKVDVNLLSSIKTLKLVGITIEVKDSFCKGFNQGNNENMAVDLHIELQVLRCKYFCNNNF